ncbi:MAG TPA: hypothetical protein VH682_07895 [Gemmataceae bacterium]|jgi:hypothetical protein
MVEIGLQWVHVLLRGYGGEDPTHSRFFDLLGVEPNSPLRVSPCQSPWQAATIELFVVAMKDLQTSLEPTEEFAVRTEQGFQRAAAWLRSRSVTAFEQWRALRMKADIFIGGWLANEQLDLHLPVEFLLECGRLGLPIKICTND